MFLLGRVTVFWKRLGTVIGFDPGAQIEMIDKLSWAVPDTPMHESFYGYHPPLGFLLARLIHLLGASPEVSIQIVSFAASLLAFFFLRETLRHLQLLDRPSGMAFLYLTSSIPIQISVSTSMNLDVIILAMGSAVLCASVHLLWPHVGFKDHEAQCPLPLRFDRHDPVLRERSYAHAIAGVATTAAIAFALLTKFSGILLLGIPPLAAWSQPYGYGWWKRCTLGTVACACAILIVFPYYYGRYYMQEGTFLPLNTEWTAKEDTERAIAKRNEDPVQFFVELFGPTSVHASAGPTHTDYDVNHLSDAWRDLWIRNQWTGNTTPRALQAGLLYMHVFPWLIFGGLLLFLERIRRRTPWIRLGWILVTFSILQVLALIQYIYRIPFAGYGPAKGLYILPTVWGIGYLAVMAFQEKRLVPKRFRHRTALLQHGLLLIVALFVVVNHVIPAY